MLNQKLIKFAFSTQNFGNGKVFKSTVEVGRFTHFYST